MASPGTWLSPIEIETDISMNADRPYREDAGLPGVSFLSRRPVTQELSHEAWRYRYRALFEEFRVALEDKAVQDSVLSKDVLRVMEHWNDQATFEVCAVPLAIP